MRIKTAVGICLSGVILTSLATYGQSKLPAPDKPFCPPPKIHSHRECPDNTPYTFDHCMHIYAMYEDACFTNFPQDCKRLGKVFYGPKCKPYWRWVKGNDPHQFPYPRQFWIFHMEGI